MISRSATFGLIPTVSIQATIQFADDSLKKSAKNHPLVINPKVFAFVELGVVDVSDLCVIL